ncbi:MAG: phosphonopyruvate decarboxylase [Candidatus Pacearchaeota archaeon]|jgi:phosphonopyruvate decarboxylase|nr:phosphonopyruvate decarboxylase [Clostridia bacterium]
MVDTQKFGDFLKQEGFDFFTGVPCSWMKSLINYAQNDCEYYNAANEGDAIAIAAGAHIAGRNTVVMMQNSGFGNAVSPLTSLNYIFKIPSLVFVSMRTGSDTEPQHELMGVITAKLIKTMKMKSVVLSKDDEIAKQQIAEAKAIMAKTNMPYFILVEKDTFNSVKLIPKQKTLKDVAPIGFANTLNQEVMDMTRYEVLKSISTIDKDAVYIATTGMTGRELYDIKDKKNNLYMVGSMGCAGAIGLGVALNTDKKVYVIDGDGAALMRLSVLPLIAEYAPSNMLHILLDNNVHDTTGGQATLSNNVSWNKLASSMNYQNAIVRSYGQLENALTNWKKDKERTLKLIVVPTVPGSKDPLGRPAVTPVQVKKRLMKFLKK